MAHGAQRVFFEEVKREFPEFFSGQRVLEVGSLNINGTARDFFDNCAYVGVDVAAGNDVDIVAQGQDLTYPDNSFDIAISGECFEHNPHWQATFNNMKRMTRTGGLVAFTCASDGRPEHGTSRSDVGSSPLTVGLGWDYYRNLGEADFTQDDLAGFSSYAFYDNRVNLDLYFLGVVGKKADKRVANVLKALKDVNWQ
jgi:SAM-dependent methyltransferase